MDNFDIKLTLEATNLTTGKTSVTTQTYPDSSYPSLVAVQEAVVTALLNLGKSKIAAEKK